jgi:oxygen-independent coproporphyrinogen III oxidase
MFTRPTWLQPRTAYIHIPFCGHHCGYCDFAVTAGQDHLITQYLDALELELATLREPAPIESLFVGGGTPTYLSAKQLDQLFTALDKWLPRVGENPEVSIESTPESLDVEKAEVLAAHGVNRISIGVQSFQPHLLQSLDRRHGVTQIPAAIAAVRPRIAQLSFDLIFASPGQTLAEWQLDLETALSYAPDHLSTYGLTYETGTPLWKARKQGTVLATSEDLETEMYRLAMDYLPAHGFEQYEISNFAHPGKHSQHNGRYWANDAYHGFGVGAARYVEGSRELNVRDTQSYIRKVLSGESPTYQREVLAPHERAMETVAVQLRRAQGINLEAFAIQTGYEIIFLLGDRLPQLIDLGLLQEKNAQIQLTTTGKFVADAVIADLMKAEVKQVVRAGLEPAT